VTGHMGMAQGCAGTGSDYILGIFFFQKRVIKHWNRLPREVFDAPNLSAFNRHLDNVLNNMPKPLVSSEVVRQLD